MKKNKFILAALLVVAAAGSAFAVKSAKVAPANVYTSPDGINYTLTSCATTGTINCAPATVPNPSVYYSFDGTSYTHLDPGTSLKRAQ